MGREEDITPRIASDILRLLKSMDDSTMVVGVIPRSRAAKILRDIEQQRQRRLLGIRKARSWLRAAGRVARKDPFTS